MIVIIIFKYLVHQWRMTTPSITIIWYFHNDLNHFSHIHVPPVTIRTKCIDPVKILWDWYYKNIAHRLFIAMKVNCKYIIGKFLSSRSYTFYSGKRSDATFNNGLYKIIFLRIPSHASISGDELAYLCTNNASENSEISMFIQSLSKDLELSYQNLHTLAKNPLAQHFQ